jgi:predicted RNase H-like HicB family nuclease
MPCSKKNQVIKPTFIASVWQEASCFVAQCLEVDIPSKGETEAEALGNLSEVLSLHFEPPLASITL